MQRRNNNFIHNLAKCALSLLCAVVAFTSCIMQGEGDCKVTYKLRFVYDYNMKWADATAHEVNSVRFFAFDSNGNLVYSAVESGQKLIDNNFTVELPLNPGNYRIVAWCGADGNPGDESFIIADGKPVTKESDLTAYMVRKNDPQVGPSSSINLHPLYYGSLDLTLPDYSYEGGEYVSVVYLKKDTNKIKIMLQQLNGDKVDVSDFAFEISEDNGYLAADNSVIKDQVLTYYPWVEYNAEAGVISPETQALTKVNVAQAEFTVNRLVTEHHSNMMLSVYRKRDGKKIIYLPVIDYCLMAKSFELSTVTDQEYLDRQDEYAMLFFLDEGLRWIETNIYINSWHIVFNNQSIVTD
ncbi:MAG: FimB/Mfa2 family fimbrial subunit [Bacteroidales bacterium]|nr:FimB/Mfa2 family fimbrial subunit [Bacteroidales bacterium]